MGCYFLRQELFLTQGSNPGLPHCRWILYHLRHQGSPLGIGLDGKLRIPNRQNAMQLGESSGGSLCTNEAESQDIKRKNAAGVFFTIIHGVGRLFLQRLILEMTVPLRSSIPSVLSSPARTSELARTLAFPTEPRTPGAPEMGQGLLQGLPRWPAPGPEPSLPRTPGPSSLSILTCTHRPSQAFSSSLQVYACCVQPFPLLQGANSGGWAPFQKDSPVTQLTCNDPPLSPTASPPTPSPGCI